MNKYIDFKIKGKNRLCNARLYPENNLELKNLDLEPFDIVICDGPYGVLGSEVDAAECEWDSFVLNGKGGTNSFKEYYKRLFDVCLPHMKESASIFICGYPEGMSAVKNLLDEEYSLNFRRWITWSYDNHFDFDRGTNFHRSQETILYYTKTMSGFTFRGGGVRDILSCPIIKHESKWANDTNPNHIDIAHEFKDGAKPLELMRPLLSATADFGGRLLSLFAGSGTDLNVAAEYDMDSVGFEFNPRHVDIITERLKGREECVVL